MKVAPLSLALSMGYSADKRRQRREHRLNARHIRHENRRNSQTLEETIRWHLAQARYLGR